MVDHSILDPQSQPLSIVGEPTFTLVRDGVRKFFGKHYSSIYSTTIVHSTSCRSIVVVTVRFVVLALLTLGFTACFTISLHFDRYFITTAVVEQRNRIPVHQVQILQQEVAFIEEQSCRVSRRRAWWQPFTLWNNNNNNYYNTNRWDLPRRTSSGRSLLRHTSTANNPL